MLVAISAVRAELPPQPPIFDPQPPTLVQGDVVTVFISDAEWVCYYDGGVGGAQWQPSCGQTENSCQVLGNSTESGGDGGSGADNGTNVTVIGEHAPLFQIGASVSIGPITQAVNISTVGCRMWTPTSTNGTREVLEGPIGVARYSISSTDAGVPFAKPASGSLVRLHSEINICSVLAEFICVTSATDSQSGWPEDPRCPSGNGNACPVGRYSKGDNVTVTVDHLGANESNPQWKVIGCRLGPGGDSPTITLLEFTVGPIAGPASIEVGQYAGAAESEMKDKLRINGPDAIQWAGHRPNRRLLNDNATNSTNTTTSAVDDLAPTSSPNAGSATSQTPSPSTHANSLPDTKIPSYLVRHGAVITATAPSASAVCMTATVFSFGSKLPTDDAPCETICASPVCLPDGTCAAPSSTNPINIEIPGSTTIVRAISCQDIRPGVAGTSFSNVTEARFTPGIRVSDVVFSPISTGIVQEFTNITMSATNSSLICWTDDLSIDPFTFQFCNPSGSECVAPAKDSRTSTITMKSDMSPYTVTAKGCTNTKNACEESGCNPLGTNSPRFTLGTFGIGIEAETPKFFPEGGDGTLNKPPTPMIATDTVIMTSLGARSICWTARKKSKDGKIIHRWDSITDEWVKSGAETDPPGWPLPECNFAGTVCLQGASRGESTPINMFDAIGKVSDDSYESVEIRSIGCVDTIPGTGGGTNSPIQSNVYRIVPRIYAPTFHSQPIEGRTTFQGTNGKVVLREQESQAKFYCYTMIAYNRITKQPFDGLAVRPQCTDDGAGCSAGTKLELAFHEGTSKTSSKPIPVLADTIIQAQACTTSTPYIAQSNRNSDVSSAVYLVVPGDSAVLTALEDFKKKASANSVWNIEWDLENFHYCDAHGVTCGICPNEDLNCKAKEKVTKLSISYNGLAGEFSAFELSTFKDTLVELTLAGNSLTGGIPSSLFTLNKLTSLSLFYNSLSGNLPDAIGSLTNLIELDLDQNVFTGPIPDSFSKLTKLTKLDLGNNRITGEIPKGLSALTKLEKLDLGHNQLVGKIPAELDSLIRLKALNVAGNPELDETLSDVLCLRTRTCMATFEENAAGAGSESKKLLLIASTASLVLWFALSAR